MAYPGSQESWNQSFVWLVFSSEIYTMVGKTICLFRKQPTGCYRLVSSPKDLANFDWSRKALSRQEGAPRFWCPHSYNSLEIKLLSGSLAHV